MNPHTIEKPWWWPFYIPFWVLDGNTISISMAYLLLTYFHFCSFPMIVITIFSIEPESKKKYAVEINVTDDVVSVKVPENVAHDVAGNKNLASETLLIRPCKGSHSYLLLSAQL